jgi:hypothetical protein
MPDERKWRFQFSIRGMMVMTAAVAVGCSVGCLKTAELEDALFAFVSTWIVIGLAVQIADLWTAFRQTTGLSADQRSGWWFAILSRTALAMLLIGHFLLMELLATGRVTLAGARGDSFSNQPLGHESLRNAILAMSLLLIFAGLEARAAPVKLRRWSPAIKLLSALAIGVCLYYLLLYQFLVYGLVHIACAGIAQGMPSRGDYAKIYSAARALSFLAWALLAFGLVLLDLFCIRQLISSWKQGTRRRAIVIAVLGISLALTAIHPAWLATRGLRGVSPFFAEVFPIRPINRWLFGILLAALFATAAARRMIPIGETAAGEADTNWRRRSSAYFHEYRLLAFFVAATIVGMAAHQFMLALKDWTALTGFFQTTAQMVTQTLQSGAFDSRCQLWFVVFCFALYRAVGIKRNSHAASPELPLSLFAVVWTALLATVLMAVPISAALGFGLALNWWRLPF